MEDQVLCWAPLGFDQYILLFLKILALLNWKAQIDKSHLAPQERRWTWLNWLLRKGEEGEQTGNSLYLSSSLWSNHLGCCLKSELFLFLSHVNCHFRCNISLNPFLPHDLYKSYRQGLSALSQCSVLLFNFCCIWLNLSSSVFRQSICLNLLNVDSVYFYYSDFKY